ncbi:MAG: UDP-N-acetylglucosamine--N-acetylmuramyl-(pentapeptide) pyrophosphoryl-undecaprenol N-acetylglucosamine transferase, partial [Pygmaiobacter sp.]
EQNAFPGVTNKILAKSVDLVFAAMPDAVSKLGVPHKTIVTGNPVRSEIVSQNREEARRVLDIPPDKLVLLSFGGSLGARRINEVAADLAQWHLANRDFLHIHATGSYGVELFQTLCKEKKIFGNCNLRVNEYIKDMARCLAAADLVISRSGAITISELAAAGRASILIPSPNVAENHQYYNALELSNAGAAVLIEEKDLSSDVLIETVDRLTTDRATLRNMGVAAKACAHLNSLDKIYVYLTRLMRGELDSIHEETPKVSGNPEKLD